jgi:hypothetical protein
MMRNREGTLKNAIDSQLMCTPERDAHQTKNIMERIERCKKLFVLPGAGDDPGVGFSEIEIAIGIEIVFFRFQPRFRFGSAKQK